MSPTELAVEPTVVLEGTVRWGAVAIALIGGFLLARRRPAYALGAVIAALPLYQFRGHVGIPTTFLELLLLSVLAGVTTRWPAYRPVRTPFDPWLVLWVGGALLAALLGPDLKDGLGLWRAFFFEPAVFFVVVAAVFRRDGTRPILWGALGGISVIAVWTVILLVTTGNVSYDHRLVGPYQSPNYTALILVPYLFISALWPSRELLVPRMLLGAVALGLLFGTDSRGGEVALIAGILITLYAATRRRLVLAGLAAVVLAGSLLFKDVLFTNPSAQHAAARPALWSETVKLLKEDPLFPTAPGQFQETFTRRVENVEAYRLYVAPYSLNPHNLVLTVWVEWGLLTLLGLLGLLGTFALQLFRRGNRSQLVPLAVMTAILVHGLVDTPVLKNDLAIIFMLTLLLSTVPLNHESLQPPLHRAKAKRNRHSLKPKRAQ